MDEVFTRNWINLNLIDSHLVMGHTEDLAFVFEPVLLGSLYQCTM